LGHTDWYAVFLIHETVPYSLQINIWDMHVDRQLSNKYHQVISFVRWTATPSIWHEEEDL
jgi:hypothetical protein